MDLNALPSVLLNSPQVPLSIALSSVWSLERSTSEIKLMNECPWDTAVVIIN
jgi:hypothetical protein